MSDLTIDAQAPEAEIANIANEVEEKAIGAETKSEVSAFDELAGKKGFGSVDELVDAYTNLESKMNPTMQELKELKGMVKSIQETNKPEEKDPYVDLPKEQQDAINLLNGLLEKQLSSKLSPLLKKLEVEEAAGRIKSVRAKFPGVSDGELDSAITIMEKYPEMQLAEAVKIASYDRATQEAKKRTERRSKTRSSFTESASSARTGEDVDYSKMTISELESMLDVPSSRR